MIQRFSTLTCCVFLLGCGGSDPASPDATTPDAPTADAADSAFACAGKSLPTTAPDPLTAAGHLVDLIGQTALAGATVAAYSVTSSDPLATTTTDSSGGFTITTPSGGKPIDGYLVASLAGYLTTYDYGPAPLAADATGFALGLATQTERDTSASRVGVTPLAGHGAMLIRAVDCNDMPLAGATIATEPAAEERYVAGGVLSSAATMTDASGTVFVYNVAPGAVTIHATVGGRQLRDHVVAAYADADTFTSIQP